ncbi:MAG: hypothetical protein ACYSTL_05925 [Planctomycetota bacterium]
MDDFQGPVGVQEQSGSSYEWHESDAIPGAKPRPSGDQEQTPFLIQQGTQTQPQVLCDEPTGNFALSVAGAILGAGAGAVIWFAVAYLTGIEIGYIAILVGSLAGWGAVGLGKIRSPGVGCIAAVAGVVGIFAGSYAGFHYGIHKAMEKTQFEQEFYLTERAVDPTFDHLTPQQKQLLCEEAYKEFTRDDPGYLASITDSPWDLVVTILFGVLGLYYGFRVGSGDTGWGLAR